MKTLTFYFKTVLKCTIDKKGNKISCTLYVLYYNLDLLV